MTVPHQWRKSTYSGQQSDCVEVAPSSQEVQVRDTKARSAGHLTVPADSWKAFLITL